MNLSNEKLIENYENACNAILEAFAKKQGLESDGWMGKQIGDTVSFNEHYFFSMDNMLLDLKTNQPKGLILSWQDEYSEFNHGRSEEEEQYINYNSYTMGLRLKDLTPKSLEKPLDILEDMNKQFPKGDIF